MHILKGRVFRELFDSDSSLCSDISCLLLLMPELHLGFKKDARVAKLAVWTTIHSNKCCRLHVFGGGE